jgi:hypothetical protein
MYGTFRTEVPYASVAFADYQALVAQYVSPAAPAPAPPSFIREAATRWGALVADALTRGCWLVSMPAANDDSDAAADLRGALSQAMRAIEIAITVRQAHADAALYGRSAIAAHGHNAAQRRSIWTEIRAVRLSSAIHANAVHGRIDLRLLLAPALASARAGDTAAAALWARHCGMLDLPLAVLTGEGTYNEFIATIAASDPDLARALAAELDG